MSSILMILSSATAWTQKDGTQRTTGFWAEELTVPHQIFRAAGVDVIFATPDGAPAVVDALSLSVEANHGDSDKVARITAYLADLADALATPHKLGTLNMADFAAVFVPGGHAPMQDLAVNNDVGHVLAAAVKNPAQVVAAVCHGAASFLAAGTDQAWAFKGRTMCAFTNEEETQTGLAANAPWLLEDRLRDAGAVFAPGAPWASKVVIDGNLVTGQNPASADATALAVLHLIGAQRA